MPAATTVADTVQKIQNAAVQTAGEVTLPAWELTLKGGWIMAILGLMSLIAIYVFIDRYLAINRASRDEGNFMNNLRDFIHQGKIDAAKALCKSNDSPIARMVEKGLLRLGRPLNDINATIENVGKLEISRLEKNMAGLATISGAGPMLGFLGTVTGMIRAFYNMAMAGNNIDIQILSSGIYEAMVTTVGGLIVGVLAYVAYNILVSRIEKLVFKLEFTATEFMDLLNEPAS
ncbi:MAG TPA: biopolymer transporter ExbB [Bacteroidales bacterium]|nr:MAG: biopolymer transporter ExbB [Bacteroidetes bacterium GWE2_42_24]OFY30781.1 MAG: biopolymer transporter ExbB [Bacteroidetes bacterium GWF2_43_11]PKP17169.1 MAG: biopolymer transporter ExbB [Bacteroidetes bacterium HGW-Bacteroidetes-22]HBZ65325.1 biopolymer transporter ExbB [Bacteroidales bacterium]